jgi:tubulin-specific chaperone B
MSFQATPADVSVIISTASPTQSTSNEPFLATERRITPSWSIDQLKGKLETMTGIPPGSQRLLFKSPGRPDQWIEGEDRLIGEWGLVRGCEIEVCSFGQGVVMARGELMYYDRSMIHAQ